MRFIYIDSQENLSNLSIDLLISFQIETSAEIILKEPCDYLALIALLITTTAEKESIRIETNRFQ